MKYTLLLKHRFTKPYLHKYWSRIVQEEIKWNDVYYFIKHIPDNRYKQFKFRVLNRIFTSREILHSWKMVQNPLCLKCDTVENYQHLFIECSAVNLFWLQIQNLFRSCGIHRSIRNLKTLFFGYNVSDKHYFYINMGITIVGFSIYKTYFVQKIHLDRWNLSCCKVTLNNFQIINANIT